MRIYLLRHGQVAANKEMRYVGRNDEELTEAGRGQARALAEAFGDVALDAVVSSPRIRARETARAVLAHHPLGTGALRCDERLAEQDFGEWEGCSRDDIKARGEEAREQLALFDRSPAQAAPGGESFEQLARRTAEVLREVRTAGVERLMVVSHVGPTKALAAETLDLELLAVRRLFLDPGTFSVIDWGRFGVLRLWNAPGHRQWLDSRWMSGHRT